MQSRVSAQIAVGVLAGLATIALSGTAWGHGKAKPACEPGYQIVEEVVYKEVCKFHCKLVPDMKKKWVYDWVPDAFCIQKTPCGHGRCGACPQCLGPHHRKLLVKRLVDCHEDTKCVVEKTVELVPCVVYRKVPCGAAAPASELLAPPKPGAK